MYQIRRLKDTINRLAAQKQITKEEENELNKIHEKITNRYLKNKYKK